MENKTGEISIIWKDDRANAISVPISSLAELPIDSLRNLFEVRLETRNTSSILGEQNIVGNKLIFEPVIPFSRGLTYQIIFRNMQIAKIKIPPADTNNLPALIKIYPTRYELPENLIKVYLEFSHPMREGESQKYITLLSNQKDTIADVFLNLQPELWNEQRTILTVWLDPGRIKRDLIPNEQMGNPLKKGELYTLSVSSKWQDTRGLPLAQSYARQFSVISRDSISPDPKRWILDLPGAGTTHPLVINMDESLDYFLLQETIRVVDENKKSIPGSFSISAEESKLIFIPINPWSVGGHALQVASYLEDLAGNNLNRVFDRDITTTPSMPDERNYERPFVIKR
ncbi:MAG: hypothetical protein H7122_02775 [Chitinophagaceae bacterium]|nr:hypothetical protein [Chitinophagaceae bacterium]